MEKNPTTEKARWLKLTSLREKLGQKAKLEPHFKFYTLYGLIYRKDVLEAAWERVLANKGSPGIDGIVFEEIIQKGVTTFLKQIAEELRLKSYQPSPVRRVYIPKPDGRMRPLGIPTIKDRVIQMATLIIIEPIFEIDFLDCSHGFRPNKSAHEAVMQIREYLHQGYCEIYDADLQGYFDSIPHDKLMKCLQMRIADRHLLKLIRMWLKSPTIETDDKGKRHISRTDKGTPQGGVISPLLANIYLHWFDKVFHSKAGPAIWANAKLVRYADDFVVMAKYQTRRIKAFIEDKIEKWLGLKINQEKTKIVKLKEKKATLSFLGYTFRYDRSKYNKEERYLNLIPKDKAIAKAFEKIRELTNKKNNFLPINELIKRINAFLTGWEGYFNLGYPYKAYRKINYYVGYRLCRHLMRRSQKRYQAPKK